MSTPTTAIQQVLNPYLAMLVWVFLGLSVSLGHAPLWAQSAHSAPVFKGHAFAIPQEVQNKMQNVTWHEGCPVPFSNLSYIRLSYWGFDSTAHDDGILIVHKQHASQVIEIFKELFEQKFPIQSIVPMYLFGGNDSLSMAANNTSGFNCRQKSGQPGIYSNHSYGTAIDINPVQNPFVKNNVAMPILGAAYIHRHQIVAGMITPGSKALLSFRKRGWYWGGHWKKHKDYQHFEKAINIQ
jgi:hypothetical protein